MNDDKKYTKVYAHRGYVGIHSALDVEGLLNDPTQEGQIGFVLDAQHVQIQPEALDILKKVERSRDDIGDVDVFKADNGTVVFAFMGGPLRLITPESVGSNTYDASLLNATEGVVTDPNFIEVVNTILDQPEQP